MSEVDKSELQTLHRGLRVLKFLNETGPTTLAAVARYLEAPRSNARRILQTLVTDGYLERLPNSHLYAITPLVTQLSSGFNDHDVLTMVARESLYRLTKELVWPIALATPYGSRMLVRIATDHLSPVALARFNVGYLSPMLDTTTGLLFLAMSEPMVRDDVIEVLKANSELTPFFPSVGALQKALVAARANRYVIRDQKYPEGSLGVPLMFEDRFVGGLVVRYIKKAISQDKAVAELLPRMQKLAEEIVAKFARALSDRATRIERPRK